MGNEDPAVTVVVATRDRPQLLGEALDAIRTSLRPVDHLIVVDSASRNDSVRTVAESHGALVLRCEVPGTCLARNIGLRAACTEIVAFTDDDCLPHEGWLREVSAAFARPPIPDFLTGRVIAHEPRPGRAQAVLSVTEETRRVRIVAGVDPSSVGHGANMAWRRTVLEAIGGFDEFLGPGAPFKAAEDHDVVWRALRAGYSGCFEPEAVVSHRQWRSRREQLRTYYGYGVGSGALAMKRWRMRDAGLQSHSVSRLGTLRQGMGDIVWPHGVIGPMKSIRNGYEMGVLVELAMLAGGIQGMMAARTTALCRERFSRSDQQGIAR